jgi:sulfur carrier protein
MQVKVNGKSEDIQSGSVLDLLTLKKIDPQMVAVEVNDKMVDREHLATTTLKEGDLVEFLFWEAGDDVMHEITELIGKHLVR